MKAPIEEVRKEGQSTARFILDYPGKAGKKRPAHLPLPWAWLEGLGYQVPDHWPDLVTVFELNAKRFPGRWCFSSFAPLEERYTWDQTSRAVTRLAIRLRSLGLEPGGRVALTGRNSPSWAISYLSVLKAGGVVVPLDASLDSQTVQGLVEASGSRIIIADTDRLEGIKALAGTSSRDAPMAFLSLEPGSPWPWAADPGPGSLGGNTDVPPDFTPPDPESLAAILYTSGTTGNPKGVMLRHRNLVADAFLSQYHIPLTENDVFYALLPIHHSYTMLAVFIESICTGAEVVFGKQLVIRQIISDFKTGKVTMFLAVPLLFNKLLAGIMKGVHDKGPLAFHLIRALMHLSGGIKRLTGVNPGKHIFHSLLEIAGLDSLRICISGGGPLAPETFKGFNQLGLDFVQGYGLTETSPIIALNPVWCYKETSVGALVPGVEMRFADIDAQGRGEILVRGPMVMDGYYLNPDATAAVLEPDGWLHTGDSGYLDADGYLYLTGRTKNLIVTEGGKNVYPEELENLFQEWPEVEQVLVRGFTSNASTRSEGIEALIYPDQARFTDSSGTVDQAGIKKRMGEIMRELNSRLPHYQKIERFTVLDQALEMTSTRKIRRFKA